MNIAICEDEKVFLKQLHMRINSLKIHDCQISEFTSGQELLSNFVKRIFGEIMVLPVFVQNLIEVGNISIELLLIFLYFSLLSEKKNNKAAMVSSYLGSIVLMSISVLLLVNFIVNFFVTAMVSFVNFEDNLKHRVSTFWLYRLLIRS